MATVYAHGSYVKRRNWQLLAAIQVAVLVLFIGGSVLTRVQIHAYATRCAGASQQFPPASGPAPGTGAALVDCTRRPSSGVAIMVAGLILSLCMAIYWRRWYFAVLTELRNFGSSDSTRGPFADVDADKERRQITAAYIVGAMLSRFIPFATYLLLAYVLRTFLGRLKRAQSLAGVPPGEQATWVFYLCLIGGFWGPYAQRHLDRIWAIYDDPVPLAAQGAVAQHAVEPASLAAAPAVPAALVAMPAIDAPNLHAMTAGEKLLQLGDRAQAGQLSDDETWHYASAIAETHGSAHAMPWYAHLLHRRPDHVGARFGYGSALLEQGNPDGVPHLDSVVATGDPTFAQRAGEWLAWHAGQSGQAAA